MTNLYCCTTSLSIKHANALKSRSAWVSIVTNLLHLIMIGTKKHGCGFEDRLGPFSLHYASRSSLVVLTKIGHVCFSFGCGLVTEMACCTWFTFLWTFTSNMILFSIIQTKIVYMLALFFLFREGLESCFINMHEVIIWQGY
jgi:hypothetical protein